MARLKMMPTRLSRVRHRLDAAVMPDQRSARRDATVHWRAWYKTKRWQRMRWDCLVQAMFTCAMCKTLVADTSKMVADHVTPHRGDEALFFDEKNLQALCKACHDGAKQAAERSLDW
jgi:5-methylcytosine-specific restriction endonuclease McrA